MVIDTLQFFRKFITFHFFPPKVGQWQLHKIPVLTVDFTSGNCPEEPPLPHPALNWGDSAGLGSLKHCLFNCPA